MPRLCVLATYAATAFGARHHPGVDRASSATSVADRIGSLLQSFEGTKAHAKVLASLRATTDLTPEVEQTLNENLQRVIKELDEEVVTQIDLWFKKTQEEVIEKIEALTEETNQAVKDKVNADEKDNAWFECVTTEKAKREAIEVAEKNLQTAQESTVAPCASQEQLSEFQYDATNAIEWGFECDNDQGSCDLNLQNYKLAVNGMLTTLQGNVAARTKEWKLQKDLCTQARTDVETKTEALQNATRQWQEQSQTCSGFYTAREVSMCEFGNAYKRKCARASDYDQFIGKVEEQGSEWSEPDRRNEYTTVYVTKCILTQIIEDRQIDDAECRNKVDYETRFGIMDKKKAAFDEQKAQGKFDCQEVEVEFRGETWNVPAGAAPPSTSYTVEPFAPAIDRQGEHPFVFCVGTAPVSGPPGKPPSKP